MRRPEEHWYLIDRRRQRRTPVRLIAGAAVAVLALAGLKLAFGGPCDTAAWCEFPVATADAPPVPLSVVDVAVWRDFMPRTDRDPGGGVMVSVTVEVPASEVDRIRPVSIWLRYPDGLWQVGTPGEPLSSHVFQDDRDPVQLQTVVRGGPKLDVPAAVDVALGLEVDGSEQVVVVVRGVRAQRAA